MLAHSEASHYIAARENMISQQILTNKVIDGRVVNAMQTVPREQFVPTGFESVAYADEPIPLFTEPFSHARYVLEPRVFAQMLQLAELRPDDVVLDVGCGAGYSAAILSLLCRQVYGVEEEELLAARANNTLHALKFRNVSVSIGPLADGFSPQAPYDVIVINGGVKEIPEVFQGQLKEGGRVVYIRLVEGPVPVGRIALGVKRGGVVTSRDHFDAAACPLPGFTSAPEFTF